MIKHYKQFTIPYWFGKKIVLQLYRHTGEIVTYYRLAIWLYKKLDHIPGYEHEWGNNWWTFITLWKKPIIKHKCCGKPMKLKGTHEYGFYYECETCGKQLEEESI